MCPVERLAAQAVLSKTVGWYIINERRRTMASLMRMYTTEPGANPADVSFAIATPPEVKCDVEASAGEFAFAGAYDLRVHLRDFASGTTGEVSQTGALGDANWGTRNATISFTLPAAITGAAAVGGAVELFGVLRVGAAAVGAELQFGLNYFCWVAP